MNDERRKRIARVRDGLSEAKAELESLRDEEQEARDAIPESLSEGERATKSDKAIEKLGEVVDALEGLDSDLEEAAS